LGAAPRGGRRRDPERPPPVPAERPAPAPADRPVPAAVPLPAWLGLALFAAGTPIGALVAQRRRERSRRTAVRTADERA
ncbi:MAG TPA: hypothetical protein VG318_07765, partial [Actinomycetota bacterium]|nr:hypothetical protein [Actinomycetota bacterium]